MTSDPDEAFGRLMPSALLSEHRDMNYCMNYQYSYCSPSKRLKPWLLHTSATTPRCLLFSVASAGRTCYLPPLSTATKTKISSKDKHGDRTSRRVFQANWIYSRPSSISTRGGHPPTAPVPLFVPFRDPSRAASKLASTTLSIAYSTKSEKQDTFRNGASVSYTDLCCTSNTPPGLLSVGDVVKSSFCFRYFFPMLQSSPCPQPMTPSTELFSLNTRYMLSATISPSLRQGRPITLSSLTNSLQRVLC